MNSQIFWKFLVAAVLTVFSFDSIKAADPTEEITTISYRAPVGHTHTCPACSETWDHTANTGHTCKQCGTAQYVQDRVARPVTVRTKVRVKIPPVARIFNPPIAVVPVAAPPVAAVVPAHGVVIPPPKPAVVVQTGVTVASPCANGACSAPTRIAPVGPLRRLLTGW